MNDADSEAVAMSDGQVQRRDRRANSLSDEDLTKIGEAFDRRVATMFEMIGYDTSNPETRGEIRKDHEFVRDARQARGKIVGAIYTAIGGGIATVLYVGAKAMGKAP